jgi:hypothetical protein
LWYYSTAYTIGKIDNIKDEYKFTKIDNKVHYGYLEDYGFHLFELPHFKLPLKPTHNSPFFNLSALKRQCLSFIFGSKVHRRLGAGSRTGTHCPATGTRTGTTTTTGTARWKLV